MYYADQFTHNPYVAVNTEKSYIRLLHAIPNAPAVDVYANGSLIARNLQYREFTEYFSLPAGSYNIEIYSTGQTGTPIFKTTATFPGRTIFTVALIGLLSDISLLPIAEPQIMMTPGMTMLRVGHLSPAAPNLDVTLPDGTVLFSEVSYRETTDYKMVPPATYRLQARISGTDTVMLNVPNIRLQPNRYYTIYIIGLPNDQPPLQVLIPLDGQSYLRF